MFFDPGQAPWWIGLVDAVGVLLALGLWFAVRNEVWWRARSVVTAAAAVLLMLAATSRLSRVGVIGFAVGLPGFFSGDDLDRNLGVVALLAVTFAGGLWVAARGADADDDEPVEDAGDPVEEAAPPPPPAIPTRAWSRTEVLGQADVPGGAEEPARRERAALPGLGDLPKPWDVDPSTVRNVAVPLLAVAVGLGLPVLAFNASYTTYDALGAGQDVTLVAMLAHLVAGLVAGGAVLGAAIALDVWERQLAVTSFAIVAVGSFAGQAWPDAFRNQFWAAGALGLAAGLILPGVLRALRRLAALDRVSLVAGGAAAMLLMVLAAFLTANAVSSGFGPSFVDDDEFEFSSSP